MAASHAPGGGGSLTLGEAIDRYWLEIAAAGYSRQQEQRHHAAVTKHLPWAIFRRMPCEPWPEDVHATGPSGLRAKSAFIAFAWGGPVRYLTFGAAVDAFLAQGERHATTAANLRSSLRTLGRGIARCQPLSAIPARWWQSICEELPEKHRHRVLRFLRWLRDRNMIAVIVVAPPTPPFWRRDIAERIRLAPDRLTAETPWQSALGAYLRHQRDALGIREESLSPTWRALRRFGRWLDGRRTTLAQLGEAVALEYLAEEERRGLGYSSLRKIASDLRSLSTFLTQQGLFTADPLSALRVKPQSWPPLTAAPDEGKMRAVIDAARSRLQEALRRPASTRGPRQLLVLMYRDVALIEVLCGTGLRSTELCRLKVSDLDTTYGRLRVRGKGSSRHSVRERILDLPDPELRAALADYLNARQPEQDEPLFASATDQPLQYGGVDQIIERYCDRAGLGRINPRDLRHGFASALVARGADPLTVQTVMGHETLRTTMRHYVALNEQELREVWLRTNPLSRLPAHLERGEDDGCRGSDR